LEAIKEVEAKEGDFAAAVLEVVGGKEFENCVAVGDKFHKYSCLEGVLSAEVHGAAECKGEKESAVDEIVKFNECVAITDADGKATETFVKCAAPAEEEEDKEEDGEKDESGDSDGAGAAANGSNNSAEGATSLGGSIVSAAFAMAATAGAAW